MFTGLIKDIGAIAHVATHAHERVFTIAAPLLNLAAEKIGASIACNGVCLTVIRKEEQQFTALASAETLSKTTLANWEQGKLINLEPSLRLGDELGGHLVYGHVDGIARCYAVEEEGQSIRFTFSAPAELMRFIAPKGSVALDGVSLTVNEVHESSFGVNIIPHTMQHTTFANLTVGQAVNLEIDMLARYVARLNEVKAVQEKAA